MRRVVLLVLCGALAAPAGAAAQSGQDGTLLSGYSRPGGGEQAVLGSKLLPAANSGKTSLKADPASVLVPGQAEAAPLSPADGGTAPTTDSVPGLAPAARTADLSAQLPRLKRATASAGSATPAALTPATLSGTQPVAAQIAPGDAGSLLSASDLLGLLLGLAVVGGAGAAAAALVRR